MNKIELVKKLKTYAPMIFDITLSEMGYEFTAVCKKGAIFSDVGMLLSSDTEGDIPFDNWGQGKQSKYEANKNLERFLNSIELIIAWEDISLEELESLLEGIQNHKGITDR
jgi:hypothetical protein